MSKHLSDTQFENIQLALVKTSNFKPKLADLKLADLPPNEELISPAPTREMCDSLTQNGQINPIIVIDRGASNYTVREGRRRIKCARENEWKTIKALVYPAEFGELEGLLITTTTNHLRSDNPLSDLEVIEDLLARKMSESQIAYLTNIPLGTVQKLLRLLGLFQDQPDIYQGVLDGRMTLSAAEACIPLAKGHRKNVVAMLKDPDKKKVSAKDVGLAKKTQVAAGLANIKLPDMGLTQPAEPTERFVALGSGQSDEPVFLDVTLSTARQEVMTLGPTYVLYRLVPA